MIILLTTLVIITKDSNNKSNSMCVCVFECESKRSLVNKKTNECCAVS